MSMSRARKEAFLRKRQQLEPMERVIVDVRDGSRDRLVPRSVVLRRYRDAELIWDMNNHSYGVVENGVEPDWLKEFNRA